MWAIALRNGTLDSNAGRNVKRSADVWGNARHFCDFELNSKQDTRANAQGRIIGNKHRKGLGTSRADVCWNGRRPCEPEFNFRIRGRKTEARNNLTVWGYSALSNSKSFLIERFPHSLLDFLESRVVKRKSINHCALLNAQIGLNFLIGTEAHQTI